MNRVALTGVLNVLWVRPNQRGRVPSRPMANIVRAAAVAQARHTTNADRIAAIEISTESRWPEYCFAVSASTVGSDAHFAPPAFDTPCPMAITYVVQT